MAGIERARGVAGLRIRDAEQGEGPREAHMIREGGGGDLRLAKDLDDPGMLARRHEDARHLVAQVDGEGAVGVVVGEMASAASACSKNPTAAR